MGNFNSTPFPYPPRKWIFSLLYCPPDASEKVYLRNFQRYAAPLVEAGKEAYQMQFRRLIQSLILEKHVSYEKAWNLARTIAPEMFQSATSAAGAAAPSIAGAPDSTPESQSSFSNPDIDRQPYPPPTKAWLLAMLYLSPRASNEQYLAAFDRIVRPLIDAPPGAVILRLVRRIQFDEKPLSTYEALRDGKSIGKYKVADFTAAWEVAKAREPELFAYAQSLGDPLGDDDSKPAPAKR